MIFADRSDAGRRLADVLSELGELGHAIVLGIPRGGVAVAAEIARALHLPLDVFLARKLGVPGHEELAFGAVAASGARYLDPRMVRRARLNEAQIESITAEALHLLMHRAGLYRASRPPLAVAGRTAILVDDGIATGASLFAAIQAMRQLRPARIIAAIPVVPAQAASWLRGHVDQFVCLQIPEHFQAVGQFYAAFPQLSDEDVVRLLGAVQDSGGQSSGVR